MSDHIGSNPMMTIPLVKKFFQRFRVGEYVDDCWEWVGGKTRHGYGVFFVGGEKRYMRAHRFAWMLHTGKQIPSGLVIAHTCDNPSCVNFLHLRCVTQMENVADRNAKGRQDHGPNAPKWEPPTPPGKARGERAGRAKLTEDDVREIRATYRKGVRGCGYTALAKKYGVNDYAIEMIVKRKSWTHI